MTKRIGEEGYSVNFALEMIRAALRDAKIAGLLVKHVVLPKDDDKPLQQRHFSWWGEVHAETMVYEVSGECWIQRGEGSIFTSPWKYGQIEFTVDTGMTNGKVPRMFYLFDEKSGMERLRQHDIVIVHHFRVGEFSAWFVDQAETKVHNAKSKEEAVGKLMFCFPERFAFIFGEHRAG